MNRPSRLRILHLVIGAAAVAVFLATGLYMRLNFPEIYQDDQGMRMAMRSSHVYILLSGLINIVLGTYVSPVDAQRRKKLQITGSILILIAPFSLISAFFVEPFGPYVFRPITLPSMVALVVGVFLHMGVSMRTKTL